uniref:Glutaredoxin-like protein n=1 Tax=Amphora coffeiformis TaxID=265554 RepID=A0A7S3L4A4_9STRA
MVCGCRSFILHLLLLILHGSIMRIGVLGFVLQHHVRSSRRGRSVFLPPRGASVTGTVYEAAEPEAPKVTLFTKEGCTLCDKVKDVLIELRETHPHSLSQIDITDQEHARWYDKYKYDIPVLHLDSKYWIKHRMTTEEAKEGLEAFQNGTFSSPKGEPNASEMER